MSKKVLMEYKIHNKLAKGYFYGKRKVIISKYLEKILNEKPKIGKSILVKLKLKPLVGNNAELVNWKYVRK